MLEKLKAVNWDRDYDQVTFGGNLAQALLELHATENQPEFFKESLRDLYLDIQNSHPIEPAVEFVMPYVVWMCQNTHDDETRIQYCFVIGKLFDMIWGTKPDIGSLFLPTSSTEKLRQRAKIYDAVADHTAYFCELLSAKNDGLRLACFDVLRSQADEYLEILPHLSPCFETTTDIWIKALAIWHYALFAGRDWKLKKSSVEQLYDWMLSDNDLLRYTATLGRLHCHPVRSENRDAIPDIVLDNVIEYLNSDVWEAYSLPAREEFQRVVRRTLPFDWRVFDVLRQVAHNQSEPFFWFDLLKRINLTPVAAHRHCRELLRCAFIPICHPHSNYFWENNHIAIQVEAGEPIIYQHFLTDRNLGWLNQKQKVVLEFIVACDPFWEHPTNLLSHYYGLPDKRDGLRALLSNQLS